ncbi:hypothetical protein BgAZ_306160 [Babesia gibsoni]|uniref:Uncharacterized protein n=1 Tax=Babesia gibsoni TaxID=33632 RepID=A0AAD8LKE6_BABGI|nr:hypothetical protein BgAZ_306160 [Babesia gibsoni]
MDPLRPKAPGYLPSNTSRDGTPVDSADYGRSTYYYHHPQQRMPGTGTPRGIPPGQMSLPPQDRMHMTMQQEGMQHKGVVLPQQGMMQIPGYSRGIPSDHNMQGISGLAKQSGYKNGHQQQEMTMIDQPSNVVNVNQGRARMRMSQAPQNMMGATGVVDEGNNQRVNTIQFTQPTQEGLPPESTTLASGNTTIDPNEQFPLEGRNPDYEVLDAVDPALSIDTEAIIHKLESVTSLSRAENTSYLITDDTFERFGETIAEILNMQSQILESCQLLPNANGEMGPALISMDEEKLDRMIEASSRLFEGVTAVSEEMHDITDKLPPFYTRYIPYFRNLKVTAGDTTSFSHTAAPELAISRHLVRLQKQLLADKGPKHL